MTIGETLLEGKRRFGGVRCDVIGVEVLLAHVLGVRREDLFIRNDAMVSDEKLELFWGLCERFGKGEPVAYLVGCKEFYGRSFEVNKDVLIPRPETEMLVEAVLSFVKQQGIEDGVRIVDVGTGCGNIAVSLAAELPRARVTAVDVSLGALAVARRNAALHGVGERVDFVESDLLAGIDEAAPLSGGSSTRGGRAFDVVVANLPYIGTERFSVVSRETHEYEPHTALFGGEMGLELYERLFGQMAAASGGPRFLCGEFGFLQGDEMRKLLNKYFIREQWEVFKDYALIERIFTVHFGG